MSDAGFIFELILLARYDRRIHMPLNLRQGCTVLKLMVLTSSFLPELLSSI